MTMRRTAPLLTSLTMVATALAVLAGGPAAMGADNGDPAPPPPATAADDPGRIAFVRGEIGNELWTMEPDGTDQRRIATGLAGIANPTWSPDGLRLAFGARDVRSDIFVVNADGSGLVNLTDNPGFDDTEPAWSPIGDHIAFVRDEAIWMIDVEHGYEWTVFGGPAAPSRSPAWSPRGRQLVVSVLQPDSPADLTVYDLWSISWDGGTPSLNLTMTPDVSETAPSWSPDGRSIAYRGYFGWDAVDPDGAATPRTVDVTGTTDVFVRNADGGNPVNLTASQTPWEGDPAWAPDGAHLAFTRDPDPNAHGDTYRQSIWTMFPDGTRQIELTDVAGGDRAPAWQPLPFTHPIGLVDPATGLWHLRYDGRGESFYYGDPGDSPMLGDWDCDGVDTAGLYRQNDGFVYLRNSNTQGNADLRFYFGDPGDIPLAGDFNGDGCATVSLYRPGEGRVYIHNQLGSGDAGLGAAELAYYFGNPGDIPFAGDFDGNGVDTIGLYRDTTGLVYYRNSHTQGNADDQFLFGDPGDRFVAHDWTGDGVDTPAVFRPSAATFFFRYTNTQGPGDASIEFGEADWLPVAGSFELAPYPDQVVGANFLLPPQPADCDAVVAVPRLVSTSYEPYGWADLVSGAMTELVAGPRPDELAAGYTSWFSDATAGSFLGVSGEWAGYVVDLADLRPIIPNAGSSCGALGLNAQLESTVLQFQQYASDCVSFAFEGDVDAYYEFTGLAPPECDP